MLRSARDTRYRSKETIFRDAAQRLKSSLHQADTVSNMDALRGMEWEAASSYFSAFNAMLVDDNSLQLSGRTGRNCRPHQDPVNALLSFLHVMLSLDVRSACESTGMDSHVGFLHRDRPGRPSLALDLMAEFRHSPGGQKSL